jgi:hypothetical protein
VVKDLVLDDSDDEDVEYKGHFCSGWVSAELKVERQAYRGGNDPGWSHCWSEAHGDSQSKSAPKGI